MVGQRGAHLIRLSAPRWALPLTALSGGLTAWLGFAPVGWWWFPYLGFALFAALLHSAARVRSAALLGYVFGLAYFITGIAWVRISLHEFGGMPLPLAWFSAILFSAFLALYPLLAATLYRWLRPRSIVFSAVVLAAAWVFSEYLRSHLLTGFEWLSIGVSAASWWPAAFAAPLFGVFGQGFFIVLVASVLGLSLLQWQQRQRPPILPLGVTAAIAIVLPALFAQVDYSDPIGKPVKVSLLQGNIAQSMKWDPDAFVATLHKYQGLVERARGQLIILPETAIPTLIENIPAGYLENLESLAKSRQANLVIGIPQYQQGRYYNGVITRGIDAEQQYRKVHLVPFGEYMPLRGLLSWFYANFNVPMGDMAPGEINQPAMQLNGQALGVSICYEDAFARDVHRTLTDATLLLNLSNDAWFGRSAAAEQHLQLAQMRSLEFARPMLRGNNTGVTAVIDQKGQVLSRLPSFEDGILETTIDGHKGYTPYTVWGDLPILLLCLAALGIAIAQRLRRS